MKCFRQTRSTVEKTHYICGSPCLCNSSHKLPCNALVTLLQCKGFKEDRRGAAPVGRANPRPLPLGSGPAFAPFAPKGGGGGGPPPGGLGAPGTPGGGGGGGPRPPGRGGGGGPLPPGGGGGAPNIGGGGGGGPRPPGGCGGGGAPYIGGGGGGGPPPPGGGGGGGCLLYTSPSPRD